MTRTVLLVVGALLSVYLLAASTWFEHSLHVWPKLFLDHNIPAPDWTEAAGTVAGAWGVYLVVIENVWNWPIGIINSAFYIWVFWNLGLKMDTGLQVVYVILGFWGWYWWLNGGEKKDDLPITKTPAREWPILTGATTLATIAMWRYNIYIQGSAPFPDAFLTAVSLLAQYMITRKYVENWIFWILVDVLYVPLYIWKQVNLTAMLYAVFIVLAVRGYLNWKRLMVGSTA